MQNIATVMPGSLRPGESRLCIFHDGSENTPVMLDEVRELMDHTRQTMWAKINEGIRRSGDYRASDQLFIEPMQPIMMADGTTITGTTEASLWPIAFSAVDGKFIHKAQQHVEFVAFGVATTPASAATTATVTPRWGQSTGGAALGASAASATVTASKTNVPFYLNGNIQIRSFLTGANTVLVAGGDFVSDQIAIPGLCFGGTVVSTIDPAATTGGVWIGLTLGGSASFTMTARALMIKSVS